VFEDTRLEIASSFDIDLEGRLGLVESAAVKPVQLAGAARTSPPPRMAEGWGA
jgi:hypothetical protein